MTISLLAAMVMLVGKVTAYSITHSTAILSDAAESVVHGVATILAAFSFWYAAQPADRRHPYGHGRVAYFSAGFEGALVFAASLAVIASAIIGLIRGPELRHLGAGLAISAVLAAINLALGLALIRVGRRYNTLILVANGQHVLSDMWTTAGAIAGVGLVMLTGIPWLDPLAALLVGAWIMYSGGALVRRSVAGLMDAVEPELIAKLQAGLQRCVNDGLIADHHQLRCRRVNDELWIDVHVLVPGELPMVTAHRRVTQLEDAMRALFPGETVHITSHLEPADHARAHPEGHPGTPDPLA
jgi:cation diffusion facilitator family transporter